jgi:hypothetical protein
VGEKNAHRRNKQHSDESNLNCTHNIIYTGRVSVNSEIKFSKSATEHAKAQPQQNAIPALSFSENESGLFKSLSLALDPEEESVDEEEEEEEDEEVDEDEGLEKKKRRASGGERANDSAGAEKENACALSDGSSVRGAADERAANAMRIAIESR